MNTLKRAINTVLSRFGLEITRQRGTLAEMSEVDQKLIKSIESFTMSPASLWATAIAVRYVLNNAIPGDVVECGVWRGGQMMMAAKVLSCQREFRQIWLYDTFAGMTAPTQKDRSHRTDVLSLMNKFEKNQTGVLNKWNYASIEDVRANMESTLYPKNMIRYVEGPVEKTLLDPNNLPEVISVLRLDTDWYESSKFELEALYPRLSKGGVIILDDYGHWLGAKEAADEYFACNEVHLLLLPIDYYCRVAIKP